MAKVLFTVEKSTESENGGFVNTITTERKSTVFGVAKVAKIRFLLKTEEQPAIGATQELDLADYKQVERSFVGENEEIITSTWLHDLVK